MKRILLTVIMTGWAFIVIGQVPKLHQLYWSKGSIVLENKEAVEGLTSYYPSLDVVFFKGNDTHQVKTYHISRIVGLRFFDNGMLIHREFVKLDRPNLQGKALFEVIPVRDFVVLRVPESRNYQYDHRSRQYIDQQGEFTDYRYWIAREKSHQAGSLDVMPRSEANKLIAYIRAGDLDCYDQQDRVLIEEFYQEKVGDKLAQKGENNLISLSSE
ncbi:hypothetical protein OKW21_005763 [Catalinimonas alkaloidigena]|uniref:hypothetical protein n=1 Tax=Catalinimonas alkaloidigena TaxID=1075417 RepID=UPI0024070513|nr:hypothetical protein [Catalinimonas alkaloidigena]MDF9800500.1 hypothetical protein [Catalinimonas alkaloidigena]